MIGEGIHILDLRFPEHDKFNINPITGTLTRIEADHLRGSGLTSQFAVGLTHR